MGIFSRPTKDELEELSSQLIDAIYSKDNYLATKISLNDQKYTELTNDINAKFSDLKLRLGHIDLPVNGFFSERDNVYKAIDSEREYQIEMTASNERPDMIEDMHVGDTLSAINYNLRKAEEEWYNKPVPHKDAMSYLRKIAALCVQLGEKFEMPTRIWKK